LALVGSSSNNIKGVPGVGPKSAVIMLSEYGTLDHILSADPASTMLKKVGASSPEAHLSKQLVTLKIDVELSQNLKSFRL
jgi:5'-3' exonuclease